MFWTEYLVKIHYFSDPQNILSTSWQKMSFSYHQIEFKNGYFGKIVVFNL